MYGITQYVKATATVLFVTTINQTVPIAKHATSPNTIATTVITSLKTSLFQFVKLINKQIIIAVKIKPTMKPPVGPAITDGPPVSPANTGTPIIPSKI